MNDNIWSSAYWMERFEYTKKPLFERLKVYATGWCEILFTLFLSILLFVVIPFYFLPDYVASPIAVIGMLTMWEKQVESYDFSIKRNLYEFGNERYPYMTVEKFIKILKLYPKHTAVVIPCSGDIYSTPNGSDLEYIELYPRDTVGNSGLYIDISSNNVEKTYFKFQKDKIIKAIRIGEPCIEDDNDFDILSKRAMKSLNYIIDRTG